MTFLLTIGIAPTIEFQYSVRSKTITWWVPCPLLKSFQFFVKKYFDLNLNWQNSPNFSTLSLVRANINFESSHSQKFPMNHMYPGSYKQKIRVMNVNESSMMNHKVFPNTYKRIDADSLASICLIYISKHRSTRVPKVLNLPLNLRSCFCRKWLFWMDQSHFTATNAFDEDLGILGCLCWWIERQAMSLRQLLLQWWHVNLICFSAINHVGRQGDDLVQKKTSVGNLGVPQMWLSFLPHFFTENIWFLCQYQHPLWYFYCVHCVEQIKEYNGNSLIGLSRIFIFTFLY